MHSELPTIKLNAKQAQAVEQIDGPLLVVAGPGTGKTQLLSARARHILETTDTPPSAILCLTFTENGAQNMRDRLSQFIGEAAYQVQISTYHGFAQTIIGQYPDFFTEKNLQRVIDPITKHQIIQQFQDALPPNAILKKLSTHNILSTISEAKMALLKPADLRQIADSNQAELARINPKIHELTANIKKFQFKNTAAAVEFHERFLDILQPIARPPITGITALSSRAFYELKKAIQTAEETDSRVILTTWRGKFLERDAQNHLGLKDNYNDWRLRQLADCYDFYNQTIKTAGLYDFNDMILETIETIESNAQLRANLQERFLYIMLDEYQDTNRAQSRLIELITDNPIHEGRPNVMAVGDDDQAIFAFQGADHSNMLNFFNHYRQTTIINLDQNYRSHQKILDFSSNLATKIDDRLSNLLPENVFTKQLVAANDSIRDVSIERCDFDSIVAENHWLVNKISELINSGVEAHEIAVLALRHNTLSATTPYFLREQIPIRYERSQNILDNLGIQALLKIAELVTALANKRPANQLLFEILSYDIWGLETADIWRLTWASGRNDFLPTILTPSEDPDFEKIRPKFIEPALWLLEFARQSSQLSPEANFDILIGNIGLEITDNQQTAVVYSPLKSHFKQRSAEELFDFTLSINLLRERFLDFKNSHSEPKVAPLELLTSLTSLHTEIGEPIKFTNPYATSDSAVNLMTVFGAKGLEFKHVFLLETGQSEWGGSNPGRNQLSLPDNLRFIRHEKTSTDDQLRLLFVAVTRAKTHLYLLNSLYKANDRPSTRLEFLSETEDENGQFLANTIPEPFKNITHQKVSIEPELLENELFDNFTDWKNRHLESRLDFESLLRPRLERLKLSPTGLNNYLDLTYSGPEVFFFNQVLRFPSTFDLRASYGSLIHATLDHAQTIAAEVSPETFVNEVLQFFNQKLQDTNLTASDKAKIEAWAEASLPIYFKARQSIFRTNLRVKTEVGFNLSPIILDGVQLGGTIDRLEIDDAAKTITVVDYKTGKPHNTFSENDATLYNNRTQLYFYKILLERSGQYSGYKITNWRLEFITPTVDGQINFLEGEFNEKLENRTRQLITAVWQQIQAFNFNQPDLPNSMAGRKKFEQQLLDDLQ